MRFPLASSILIAAFLAAGAVARAQQDVPSRNIDNLYEFDNCGNANITVTFQYGAKDWEQWREQYGDHPDLLLRDLRYQLAKADIEDFTLDKDDVQRRAVAKLKARGLARYTGNGNFAIDVERDFRLVSGSGVDWAFTNTRLVNDELLNQTSHAKLPAGAQNAQFTEDGDFNQITYTMNVAPARPKGWLEAGVACLAASLGLGVVTVAGRKRA